MNGFTFAVSELNARVTEPWFVLQLKPKAEAIAKRNLIQQGIQVFSPFEEVTTRKAGKLIQTRKALFPGYMFISFNQDFVRWRTVNSTTGVSRLVSFTDGLPAQVPSGLISNLMRRCDPSGKLQPPQLLATGDTVRVTKGPFAELIGTVEQISANQRIWVLLDILGKNTRVAIKSAQLCLGDR